MKHIVRNLMAVAVAAALALGLLAGFGQAVLGAQLQLKTR